MGARRLVGAAGLGVLISGLIVNVYLAAVARAVPPAEYAAFGSFWALVLVLGFGAFLPLEQELARNLPRPQDRRALLRAASAASVVLAAVAALVLLVATPVVLPSLHDSMSSYLALVALCVVSAGQFLLRGILIGTDRLVRHAAVMVLDALVRLVVAVAIFILGGADAAAFCWALVASMLLSHVPQLPSAWRRAVAWSAPQQEWGPPTGVRTLMAAVTPLLVGSICAQLLLNGMPVLVVALSSAADDAAAGIFVAAFTLAKAPLSMVVPLQSAVVPTLTRAIAAGRRREVRLLLLKGVAGLSALAAIGVPLAVLLGPWLVSLVFGDEYAIGPIDLGIITAGVLAHIGLVVVTQVHVARGRHRDVAASWMAGLATAGITFALVPPPVLAGELAFLAGSAVGAVVSSLILVLGHRRATAGSVGGPVGGGPARDHAVAGSAEAPAQYPPQSPVQATEETRSES